MILDVPAKLYHADSFVKDQAPTLSASLAHVLLTSSPAHARAAHPRLNPDFVQEHDEKFDLGTVCHSLLLEGVDIMEVLAFPDYRTAAAKEARDLARSHGRIPLLSKHAHAVTEMCKAVTERLASMDVDPPLLMDGKPEQTIVWDEAGVACRARLDWLRDDGAAIDDIKTTSRSAHPDVFSRQLYGLGYDMKAAFYLRGLAAIDPDRDFIRRSVDFRWIVIETTPPYELSVVTPGPDVLTLADAKVDTALALWKQCLESDTWPGYPRQVCTAELPAWEEARWLERQDA